MKWMSYLGVSAAISAGVFLWQNGTIPIGSSPTETQHRKPQNETAPRTIFASGVVEGTSRAVPLDFEITGRIAEIKVAEGSRVKQGQLLARLDDSLQQHNLAEAQSKLLLAQAERERLVNGASAETRQLAKTAAKLAAVRVEQAKSDLERAYTALKREALSLQGYENYRFKLKLAKAEYDQAMARVDEIEAKARKDELRMANAKIKLAEAAVAQARTMLDKTKLHAPADGVILKVTAEPGELRGSENSQPMITLVNDNRIRVRAFVEELDVLNLTVGQQAEITADGLPDDRFTGTITWIAPSMQPKKQLHHQPGERIDIKTREVLIAIDDPKNLVIGLPVEVFIQPERTESPAPSQDRNPPSGDATDSSSEPETAPFNGAG